MTSGTKSRRQAVRDARMPVLFVGHGSPMNLLEDNRWSRGFRALSALVPKPRSILAISAHWYVDGTELTDDDRPKTIHDFSGFPDALYEITYPAPGDAALVARVGAVLGKRQVTPTRKWGLDHGTWSVLRWMYPEADVPVVQLSIDRQLEPRGHLELGRKLSSLRDDGVLILGSGNITHNLRDAFERSRRGESEAPEWAKRFDAEVARAVVERDTERMISLWPDSEGGRLCHPTPDHWFPLLYAYGASRPDDRITFPATGFDLGSLSMRSIVFT